MPIDPRHCGVTGQQLQPERRARLGGLQVGVCCVAALLLAGLAGCYSGSRPAGINQPAPDFTVRDGDRSLSLHDYKGQVVLLNFWATWCGPCVQEVPSLVALQGRLKDQVTILAISVDEDRNAYRQFLKDHNVSLLTIRDGEQKSNARYGTFKFPETFVIDRQGMVRRKFIGAIDWNDPEIESYLRGL